MAEKDPPVDTLSHVMEDDGDKMVTTQNPDLLSAQNTTQSPKPGKPKPKPKPAALVKFGSAAVPVYRTSSGTRVRFMISYHRDGKRRRQIFGSLDATQKEAQLVAQRIQAGMQHVTDMKPHDRDAYVTAKKMPWKNVSLILIAYLCAIAVASANPVRIDPVGDAAVYVFGLIAAICIAVEVAILWILCRAFHNFDGDRVTLAFLAILNVLTLLLVLTPILKVTRSTLLAEAAVVVAETFGIRAIMATAGVTIDLRRALIYSVAVNAISYVVGLLCQ
ncbi:MAG: hypothetical protein K9N23_12950 [Akkermansiaceae bacterium]|nr:hypothetical protein [Akkermansiaceae bacterium]MCF7732592.1 hypothetical protein [Akkermansiaceae bacterium]